MNRVVLNLLAALIVAVGGSLLLAHPPTVVPQPTKYR